MCQAQGQTLFKVVSPAPIGCQDVYMYESVHDLISESQRELKYQ